MIRAKRMMMPAAVVFELEADRTVGFGHLRRSVMIADRVRQAIPSAEIVFSGRFDEAAGEALRRLAPSAGIGFTAADEVYRSRTGGNEIVVVIDQRHSGEQAVLNHRRAGRGIICIEDVGRGRGHADILVDPNLTPRLHRRICALHGAAPRRALLGPEHVLLEPRLTALRARRHSPSGHRPRVLCSFGGADADRVSESVLELLLPGEGLFKVTIVAGPMMSPSRVSALRRRGGGGITVIHDPEDMAAVLAGTDVLVTVPGVTLWEAACLGIPAAVTWVRPHQRRLARFFSDRRWCAPCGRLNRLSSARLRENLAFLSSPSGGGAISRRLTAAVDGCGVDRLIQTAFGGIVGT